jgi:hypothetical protein
MDTHLCGNPAQITGVSVVFAYLLRFIVQVVVVQILASIPNLISLALFICCCVKFTHINGGMEE